MKKYRILRNISILLLLFLSHEMCAVVAFNYANMLCGIRHMGFSAPPDTAFLTAIPYVIGIAVCALLAFLFNRKSR